MIITTALIPVLLLQPTPRPHIPLAQLSVNGNMRAPFKTFPLHVVIFGHLSVRRARGPVVHEPKCRHGGARVSPRFPGMIGRYAETFIEDNTHDPFDS